MGVVIAIVVLLLIFVLVVLAASIRILREYERGVIFRLGRLIAQKGPGPDPADPDHRPDGQGRSANGHPDGAAAGGDHQGQRHRARQRGRLLPGHRPEPGDHRGRELPARHVPDLADDAALGAGQGRARRPALGARATQHRAAADHRRADRALGREGEHGRGQGRRAAGRHAAGDRPPGRGRAGAAGEDHLRRRRVPGGGEARPGRQHHERQPGDPPAPVPADAARHRRQPELDDHLPAAARLGEALPGPRGGRPARARAAGAPKAPSSPERSRGPHRPAHRAAGDPRPRAGRAAGCVRPGAGCHAGGRRRDLSLLRGPRGSHAAGGLGAPSRRRRARLAGLDGAGGAESVPGARRRRGGRAPGDGHRAASRDAGDGPGELDRPAAAPRPGRASRPCSRPSPPRAPTR